MRTSILSLLAIGFALLSCTERKMEVAKRDDSILGSSQNAEPRVITTHPEQSSPDFAKPRPYLIYPAKFIVIPSVLPPQDNPYYVGYDGTQGQNFEMVYVYEVAATPDYSKSKILPDLTSEAKYTAFMSAWAEDFAKDVEGVKRLDELAKSFQWQADPQMIEDRPVPVPASLLEAQPSYVMQTQRFLARRFHFKDKGSTIIQGSYQNSVFTIPFVVRSYSSSDRQRGEEIYKDPKTGCQNCHSISSESSQAVYLKHSSDYLSSYTDEELLDLIELSRFPSGDLFLDGKHQYNIPSVDEAAIIAYLRSLPSTYDKSMELSEVYRFKVRFPGWP